MIDGKDKKRYILMDMTHADYDDTISAFRTIHVDKSFAENPDYTIDPDELLTILPNNADTQAIVKVIGLEDEATILTEGLASGLFLNIYERSDLLIVNSILGSTAWTPPE